LMRGIRERRRFCAGRARLEGVEVGDEAFEVEASAPGATRTVARALQGAEHCGRRASALDLVVVGILGDALEDFGRGVCCLGEAGLGAGEGGSSGGGEVGLDLGGLGEVEESPKLEAGAGGELDERAFASEEGDDDVGLIGRERREVVELVPHEARIRARRRDARFGARMTGRLRAGVVDRGRKGAERRRGGEIGGAWMLQRCRSGRCDGRMRVWCDRAMNAPTFRHVGGTVFSATEVGPPTSVLRANML